MKSPHYCKHYRAMYGNKTCNAGVEYEKFKGLTIYKQPCFRNKGEDVRPGCELAEFMNAEEEAAYEADIKAHFGRIATARKAIIEHCQDKKGCAGAIPCPVCDGGELHYSRASNGHVHARCSTSDCVSWME